MTPPVKPRQEHIAFLDYLRGVAILLVFLFHGLDPSIGADHLSFAGWFRNFKGGGLFLDFMFPVTLGWLGVAIFFVISGFCIHLSHERSRDKSFSVYFLRRFFRIYPPYLIAVLFFAFIYPPTRLHFGANAGMATAQLLTHLLMIHNLDSHTYWGINGVFWTVAVEVQLYCLYPLVLWITARVGWSRVLWITAGVEIVTRLLLGAFPHATSFHPYLPGVPFLYWYSWTIGAALAEAHMKKISLPFSSTPLYVWPAATVVAYLFAPLYPFTFLFAALATAHVVAYLLKLPSAVFAPSGRFGFLFHYLGFVGLISYSVYLLHQPLVNLVPVLLGDLFPGRHFSPPVIYLACLAMWVPVSLISYAFYRGVETPSIAVGKWIIAKRTRARS